jgi:hypothetical protein
VAAAQYEGSTQDPCGVIAAMYLPQPFSIFKALGYVSIFSVLSDPPVSHFPFRICKNHTPFTMSENIPPHQQFYPDQHAIQHAQRGPDHMGTATHHPLSGPHPIVCISRTVNNVLFTFPASYPDFRRALHALLQLDIIAKMCVRSLRTTVQKADYDIVSVLVLFLLISEIFHMMSQISLKSVAIHSFRSPVTKYTK